MPDGDLPRRQLGGDVGRGSPGEVETERRHATRRRAKPVELDRLRQPGEEAAAELGLVAHDRLPAQRLHVLDGSDEAGEQLVLLGAVLVAVPDRLVRRRAHLVRPPRAEQLGVAVGEPEMRPEELVRRAEEDVDVPRLDVDRAVRPVVDRVGPGERTGRMRQLDDPRDVGHRADRVRRDRERDDLRPVGQLPLEVREVEREVVVHLDEADDDAEVVLELEPRRHVGVVVELRDEDLVARRERASERAREQEVERGHALPERDLVGVAAEPAAGRRACTLDQLLRADARLVGRADVRVVLAEVGRDRVDHLVRALRSAWRVEKGERAIERREPRPHGPTSSSVGAPTRDSPLR